jgi:hypothetical protein
MLNFNRRLPIEIAHYLYRHLRKLLRKSDCLYDHSRTIVCPSLLGLHGKFLPRLAEKKGPAG